MYDASAAEMAEIAATLATISAVATVAFIWLRDRLSQGQRQKQLRGAGLRHAHAFQQQDTRLTLREGLAEFYGERVLLTPRDLGPKTQAGLRAHDAAHVVFGCDESPRGEVVLTRWSLFGSRDALPQYITGLRSPETRWLFVDFFRKLRPSQLILGVLDGFVALGRSLRMTRRWPGGASGDWEHYLDRPLVEIRREYNIRVV